MLNAVILWTGADIKTTMRNIKWLLIYLCNTHIKSNEYLQEIVYLYVLC